MHVHKLYVYLILSYHITSIYAHKVSNTKKGKFVSINIDSNFRDNVTDCRKTGLVQQHHLIFCSN